MDVVDSTRPSPVNVRYVVLYEQRFITPIKFAGLLGLEARLPTLLFVAWLLQDVARAWRSVATPLVEVLARWRYSECFDAYFC